MKSLQSVLDTYGEISLLERILRHNSVTFDAGRRENVAEHSYSLTVLGAAVAYDLNQTSKQQLGIGKVTQFAIVHDLVETYMDDGDISVYASSKLLNSKKEAEEKALQKLEDKIKHTWVIDTVKEYESQNTPEAHFVYALDKLVVHMNVILSDEHHANPTFDDYVRTEKVAREKISRSYPELLGYFDELCQISREKPHFFKTHVNE